MRSPLKWIGGKSRLARRIAAGLPAHRAYVEAFLGAGWVFFAKDPSPVEVINDLDGDLINLWRIWQHPRTLAAFLDRLNRHPISRQLFMEYAACDLAALEPVERACRYYFLVRSAFSGSVAGCNPSWSTSSRRRNGFAHFYGLDWAMILERLKLVDIENRSFEKVIRTYDSPETVFYLDPPYTTSRSDYYQAVFTADDHERLSTMLARVRGKFVLSYDDSPLIRRLYRGFEIEKVEVLRSADKVTGAERRTQNELLIRNYTCPPFEGNRLPSGGPDDSLSHVAKRQEVVEERGSM